MKKIIQIARLELSLLFYSPIAWLLIMVLFVQMVLTFGVMVGQLQHLQHFGLELDFLTNRFYTATNVGAGGIYALILKSLYLYTPLITMGIISRETNSGSIKLLYSSPVKLSEIIFGKFVSMLAFNLVIIGVMGLFFIFGVLFIENFDYPHPLVAMFTCFLLLSAYAAIGIFMSSLTTYQVVAAISTFMILGSLNYIGSFGQRIDFVRDLTHSLAIGSRTNLMINGLMNSRDVIYYLVISGMFLAFTITRLDFARQTRPFLRQLSRYGLIVIVGLAVAYLSSRQPLIAYYDATDTKVNTIVKATQKILKDMGDEPVEVTEYINVMDYTYSNADPGLRILDIARWEAYLRFKSNIKLKWVYYYDSIPAPQFYAANPGKSLKTLFKERVKALELDTNDFLEPELIRKQVNLSGENGRLVMQVKYKNKTTFLRTFDDSDFWPGEPETAAALKRLIVIPPKLVFATDGYQRSVDKVGDRDYKMFFNIKTARASLINQGFDVDSIAIENHEIPSGIAALIIGDPKVAYSPAALTKIKKYVADGGNLLIVGEPGKQSVVNPLLDSLGVKMLDGTLVQRSRDYSYNLVTPRLTKEALSMYSGLNNPYQKKEIISMPGVAALSFDPQSAFKTQAILTTDAKYSWIKKGSFVLDSAALVFEAKNGDQQGAFPGALMLTRKMTHKEQRIVVAGDADFFSNKELGRSNLQTANGTLAIAIFTWFSNNEFPVDMSRPPSKDNKLKLNKAGVKTVKIVYYGLIPGAIVLLGMVLLIRRKRK
ncbi:ABC transporter permease [Pedobacter hiemivivus]|uniref:ABC transporter permease n=1 Tax=Pedobacter hiemivivus TaxID=2530454 RepID=A0A4U1FW90_9SPHI|nr:Gldg family protein [Pedobacter hiemivivus]TCC84487.1 ABC transporter permease [Pedobacter hiemivivus]TKC55175.1 ABC transporter permease [Pedobacter hiemivivus]